MKKEIRILGIDDGCFTFFSKSVLVVGVVMRGNCEIDGILSCSIKKDGFDSTEKLIHLVRNSKHFGQLRAIMINGSTLGGFNVVDINALSKEAGLPVISVFRKKPNDQKILKTLYRFPQGRKKYLVFKKAGEVHEFKGIYFQVSSADKNKTQEIINKSLLKSKIPEPVRVAHLIASGVTAGKSTKRV